MEGAEGGGQETPKSKCVCDNDSLHGGFEDEARPRPKNVTIGGTDQHILQQ